MSLRCLYSLWMRGSVNHDELILQHIHENRTIKSVRSGNLTVNTENAGYGVAVLSKNSNPDFGPLQSRISPLELLMLTLRVPKGNGNTGSRCLYTSDLYIYLREEQHRILST